MISRGVYSTERYFSSRLFEKLAFHATAEKETLLSRRYSYASYNALLDYRAFFCEIITRKREREGKRKKKEREAKAKALCSYPRGQNAILSRRFYLWHV